MRYEKEKKGSGEPKKEKKKKKKKIPLHSQYNETTGVKKKKMMYCRLTCL